MAVLLPVAELVAALLLLPTATAWLGGWCALGLLLSFTAGIGYNLARGRHPACHCFGQLHSKPVGWSTLARNVGLALLAVLIVSQGRDQVGTSAFAWLAGLTIGEYVGLGIGLVALLGVGALTWFLTQLLAQQGRILSRVEALEARPGVAPATAPTRNGAPAVQGLPVGAPAPTFALRDLEGRRVSLADLLTSRRPVLLLFVDPNCGPCFALLPEAARWAKEHAESFTLTLVSRGTIKENRKKMTSDHGLHVLLQEKHEVSERYSTLGTPSAVLVRADGRVGSAVAAGTEAIKALIARTAGAARATIGSTASAPGGEYGISVGAQAPAITLHDLNGRTIDLARFRGQDTLVLFWNPQCGFCQRMRPDLKSWEEAETFRKPRLLVVSTGTPEANLAMGLKSPVVLDADFTMGKKFGVGGTPSAVLVDAEGRIASQVAAGAQAVLAIAAPLPALL